MKTQRKSKVPHVVDRSIKGTFIPLMTHLRFHRCRMSHSQQAALVQSVEKPLRAGPLIFCFNWRSCRYILDRHADTSSTVEFCSRRHLDASFEQVRRADGVTGSGALTLASLVYSIYLNCRAFTTQGSLLFVESLVCVQTTGSRLANGCFPSQTELLKTSRVLLGYGVRTTDKYTSAIFEYFGLSGIRRLSVLTLRPPGNLRAPLRDYRHFV